MMIMSDKELDKMRDEVRAKINRATIDLAQAEDYFMNYKYADYKKNLKEVVNSIVDLVGISKSKFD